MNTKISKKVLLLCGFVVMLVGLSAQNSVDPKKKLCDGTMKSTKYIVVGKQISTKNFKTVSGERYNSVLIKVQKVISGSLSTDTLEVLTFQGRDNVSPSEDFKSSDNIYIPIAPAIYFCGDETGTGITLNSKIIKIWDIVFINKDNDKITGNGIGDFFSTQTELFEYLKTNYSIGNN